MGVPQGSNLVSLLILIFNNDNVKISSLLKFKLVADDASIYPSDCNKFDLYGAINAEIVKVCNWILVNKLALNYDKTVYPLFEGKK